MNEHTSLSFASSDPQALLDALIAVGYRGILINGEVALRVSNSGVQRAVDMAALHGGRRMR